MIKVVEEEIPVNVYQQLRVDAGLSPKSTTAAAIGLSNTIYSVVAKDEFDVHIGMGRIIGDGGCFCQVVDICVLTEHQGKGIGKKIMAMIKAYIDYKLPESCYVSLLADGNADKLYKQFGFKETLPQSKGMFVKK